MQIARLNFRRHFVLLACALAVIIILAQLEIFGSSSLLPNAAIYGALHAIAFTGALDAAATLARKGLFILLAAVLDVAALYIGIFSLSLLSTVPLGIGARVYVAFGISAITGAICYGMLIRRFWLTELTPRPIARISLMFHRHACGVVARELERRDRPVGFGGGMVGRVLGGPMDLRANAPAPDARRALTGGPAIAAARSSNSAASSARVHRQFAPDPGCAARAPDSES
jgi:hypothetical protein